MALFLSHAHTNKDPLQELRRALEGRGLACWEDARELRAGDQLLELERRVREARGFVVLVTPDSLGSTWVHRECRWAQAAASASGGAYRLVALVQGVKPEAAELLIGEGERVVIPIEHDVLDAVPALTQAFSAAPLQGRVPVYAPAPPPRTELVLHFRGARWVLAEGKRRVHAELEIEQVSPTGARGRRQVGDVESPLGPIELGRLQWYLEVYPRWSFAENLIKGREVEGQLAPWGRALFDATLRRAEPLTGGFLASSGEKRVVIEVDSAGGGEDEATRGAAAALLALPWELLNDGDWLFAGKDPIRVIRRLPRDVVMDPLPLGHRLRVLLIVARTEDAGFLDARASLTPLVEALRPLGHKVELHVLPDGTLPALQDALGAAVDAGQPYHVVHFDGHGVYDAQRGLGLLVFEHPEDAGKPERRGAQVDAGQLGAVLLKHRVPLFVLEACQTAQAEQKVEASVAGTLLRAGVGSVVAMSHSVLVETARRFVSPFYRALVEGRRVSTAMVRGQQALFVDPRRSPDGQAEWTLQDWFVPLLFQDESGDAPLLPAGPLPNAEDLDDTWAGRLAETPPLPKHGFVGRARALLRLYRLLQGERAVALTGVGGQGKTALAIEAARWLLAIGRFERLAWVSVEHYGEARVVVDSLGRQLVAGWTGVAALVGADGNLEPAVARIERALRDWRVLVVIDNLESVLADPDPELLPLLGRIAKVGESRMLLTSRESPPEVVGAAEQRLRPLGEEEGRVLVAGVLRAAGLDVPRGEDGAWVGQLVERVGGHARSLVLLAPRVAESGAKSVVEDLGPLLAALDRAHPGDRQRSLLASVRLSLARLPPPLREMAKALSVFHGAAHVVVLAGVARVDNAAALNLCHALVALGLADAEGPFLTFEPSLAAAMEVSAEERAGFAQRWLEGMRALAEFLYRERDTDAQFTATSTRVAVAELLAILPAAEAAIAADQLSPEQAQSTTTTIEELVVPLGKPRVLAGVVAARRRLGRFFEGWSHARFDQERAELERTLDSGDVGRALSLAQALFSRGEAAGDVYTNADWDRAVACRLLGRALNASGRAGPGAEVLEEARRRFEAVEAREPGCGAARMVAVCTTGWADAQLSLGLLDEAAQGYDRVITLASAAGDSAQVAVAQNQLGIVRRLQGRYPEALNLIRASRKHDEATGDMAGVAIGWHQEAMIHRTVGDFAAAEGAYLRSLELETQLGELSMQAATLGELGNLYNSRGRLEEAADLTRRSGDLYAQLGNDRYRSFALNNLAGTLIPLGRLDDARVAITEAISLDTVFGAAAEPWTTYSVLARIEAAAHREGAAEAARAEALRLYKEFRDSGGNPHDGSGRLAEAVHAALTAGANPAALVGQLPPLDKFPPGLHPFRHALAALLAGQPANLADPRIAYDDTAELLRIRDAIAARG